MVRAGNLAWRVEVQRRVDPPRRDEFGAEIEEWDTWLTVWAEINPLQGRELQLAQQRVADVTHEIRTRWFDGVTSKHRLKRDNQIFNIEYVINPGEEYKELRFLVTEKV